MALVPMRFLYFYKETGCEVCAKAEPVIEEWRRSHLGDAFVIKLDVQFCDWEKHGFKPKAVPAYLYVVGNEPRGTFVGGLMRVKDIDRFINDSDRGGN